MNITDALFESTIPELPLENHLLIVTTDRLSAYDVVMPDPVPGKGAVLTEISLFWFRMMSDIIENQLTDLTVADRGRRR
jgi:phosphoribosylaminoimidazole-succinocarboxamide synthase